MNLWTIAYSYGNLITVNQMRNILAKFFFFLQ